MNREKRHASDHAFSGPLSSRIRHARRLSQLSQAELAKRIGVGPSAVAQWELPTGTSPTVDHLIDIATLSGTAFEWLATGRGPVTLNSTEVQAVDGISVAIDEIEDRLLMSFRRVSPRKRELFVRWMEGFF